MYPSPARFRRFFRVRSAHVGAASSLVLLALHGCAPDEPRATGATPPGGTARSSTARTPAGADDVGAGYSSNGVAPGWAVRLDERCTDFGWSAAGAGDVNGDGFGDVIVGSPGYTLGEESEGAAFVYFGSAEGPPGSPGWSTESNQAFAALGWVAPAGDVNGDGFDDVLASAYGYDDGETDEGAVFVYLGSPAGPSASADWTGGADQPSAWFGAGAAPSGELPPPACLSDI